MGHRCRIGYLESSEDEEGYLYIEWKKVFGTVTGKFKVEYCPICGMKAKKSNLHLKNPKENIEDEKKLAIELMKFYTNRIAKNDIDSEFFDFCFQNIENAISYLRGIRKGD